MRERASANLALLAVACSLLALLFSILTGWYVAQYLENGRDLARALNRIADRWEQTK